MPDIIIGSPTLTATAAATAAAAITTAAAAAATTTTTTLLRLAHAHRAAAEIGAVEGGDRLLRALRGRHLDEAETARAAGDAVDHDRDLGDGTGGGERL